MTVAVVGGGLAGALFALKLNRLRPDARILLIERGRRLGRGLAYGACAPEHLLNVPVSRMEIGLEPRFAAWLEADTARRDVMAPALAESGGDLAAAFAPRALFGAYLQERVSEALAPPGAGPGVSAVRGEAVRLREAPRFGLILADGREVDADIVILATGNLAPRAPGVPGGSLQDSPAFVPDPWAADAFADLPPDAPVLLLGTGLTMVDIALKLRGLGHVGPMLALSRRGLTPRVHAAGGAWPAFLEETLPASPITLLRHVRREVARAEAAGIPWQRVFDAARPAVAAVWRGWRLKQKRQFLRHLRPWWDVCRHRMAPRIGEGLDALIRAGRLQVEAGRLRSSRALADGGVQVTYRSAAGETKTFAAAQVVNCTGPRRDADLAGGPLLADLRARGLAMGDGLGLGLETEDSALVDRTGRPSSRLFALGALTCPSWWEIVAVPEIAVQTERLARRLARGEADLADHPLAAEDFLDLGAGI
jgi:uncharacterized NAD(P)/FAD-binding protein YdhS